MMMPDPYVIVDSLGMTYACSSDAATYTSTPSPNGQVLRLIFEQDSTTGVVNIVQVDILDQDNEQVCGTRIYRINNKASLRRLTRFLRAVEEELQ